MTKDTLFPILDTYFYILICCTTMFLIFILAVMVSSKRDSVVITKISKVLLFINVLGAIGYMLLAFIFLTL